MLGRIWIIKNHQKPPKHIWHIVAANLNGMQSLFCPFGFEKPLFTDITT